MKTVTFISALLLASATVQAQPKAEGYQFTTVVNQKVTPVKNQAATGTCWCFATTSFIEAELLRQGKGEFDLSEIVHCPPEIYEPVERQLPAPREW